MAASSSQAASSSATAAAAAAGTIVGETIVGSYLFKIDGFSGTKDLGVGKSIKSGRFSVGGHEWRIKCYPCGKDAESAGWVTLKLCLADHPSCPVEAGCVFTLMEDDVGFIVEPDGFDSFAFSREYGVDFIRREYLMKSCLEEKDDLFQVRCDVKVAKKMESPAAAVPCPGAAVAGSHVLTLDGYSKTLGRVGDGECIESHRFRVGGRTWYIKLYPRGEEGEEHGDGVVVYLCTVERHDEELKVQYEFTLLTHAGQTISSKRDFCTFSRNRNFGKPSVFLENMGHGSLPFLQNTFSLRCDMAVLEEITAVPPLPVQHRCIGDQPGPGSQQIEGDVTFDVSGHLFTAHKYVLASRSTAFMADFFGPAGKENAAADATRVRIDDMEPTVFKSLLHFIYTDSLPDNVADEEDDNKVVLAQGLLVAADRYAMERLKLICADMLCNCINNACTAVTSLDLADKHGCVRLKEACIKFLMDQFAKNAAP